jgi:hypothetical protein
MPRAKAKEPYEYKFSSNRDHEVTVTGTVTVTGDPAYLDEVMNTIRYTLEDYSFDIEMDLKEVKA